MFRFYSYVDTAEDGDPVALPPGFAIEVWKPSTDGLPPRWIGCWPNIAWWALDRARLLRNRESGLLMIVENGRIAHRSLVTAGYFRFPQMGKGDLQIGDTWTAPEYRGRGLATAAIRIVTEKWRGRFARLWYIVDDDNTASIRVIDKCGFELTGKGVRTSPFGLRLFGRFVITSRSKAPVATWRSG